MAVNTKEIKVMYDKWGNNYDSYITEEKKFHAESVYYDSVFKKYKVESVLDCGCGTGRHTTYFAEMGYDTTGLDLSEGMLEQARERARCKGLRIEFIPGSFQELSSIFNRKFDAIVCAGLAISHLVDEKELVKGLENIYKILNPGGIVLFENRRLGEILKGKKDLHFGPLQVYDKEGNQILNFRVLKDNKDNDDHTVTYNVLSFFEKENKMWEYETRSFPLWKSITPKLEELLPQTGFKKVEVSEVDFMKEHGTSDVTLAVK